MELSKECLRKKCKKLQSEHMKAWEVLHRLVGEANMPGGDAVFFDYPIKSPSLEVYDNIYGIIEEIIKHVENAGKQNI